MASIPPLQASNDGVSALTGACSGALGVLAAEGPSLAAAGIDGKGAPKNGSAGDGSEAAFQRIRSGQYQAVTVAEPLNLQGWQLVDELNRAINKVDWSGYTSPLHVVTAENISFDGGDGNIFDPGNGYRDEYAKIWGK